MPAPGKYSRCLIAIILFMLSPIMAQAKDSQAYLASAEEYYRLANYKTAVIELKNALLEDPENSRARLLLGKTYLELGEGDSALKELSRARDMGVPRAEVLEPLGRAWLMTGHTDDLLQGIHIEADDPQPLRIDILLLQGSAYLSKGMSSMADEKFSRALELQPDTAEALLGKARLAFQDADRAAASEFVDRSLAVAPDDSDAWVLKGELLRTGGNYHEALAAFEKALVTAPDNVLARLGEVTVLINLGERDKALARTNTLLEKNPQLYPAHFLKATVLSQQQLIAEADESIQLALKLAPGYAPGHLLAGSIAYQQGHLNQAESHLHVYLKQVPGNTEASKLLAATMLKLNAPDKAIEVLAPGADAAGEDAQYLALLGSAYLRNRDAAKGIEYMERAVAIAPDLAGIHTQLAIGHLAQGDIEQAVGALQSEINLDQGVLQADVLLVLTHLQNRDFDKAFTATEALREKMPDSPVPHNLKGATLLGRGEREAAKAAFESALAIKPDFLPAYLNLARLALLSGDTAAAESYYKKVLSQDKGNQKALLALAGIEERGGHKQAALNWIKQARQHHPDDISPALMLVEHYRREGETMLALEVAGGIAAIHPRNPAVVKALALTRLESGDEKGALAALRTLVEVASGAPESHYLLARLQLKLDQRDAARGSLNQAIKLQPDYAAAQLSLGKLYILEKDYPAAFEVAEALRQVHPDAAYADELKGDVHAARNEAAAAADAYALAYNRESSSHLARKLFQSRMQAGKPGAATEALRQWLEEQPGDVAVRSLLASEQIRAGKYREATQEYLRVLEADPANWLAMNNVAWLYHEAGSPEGVKYAERAYELQPQRPEVIDTLGWLLIHHGQTRRGLVLLQEATVKAPHIAEIRYHMIVALEKAGRRDEAYKELKRLLDSDAVFPGRADAMALYKRMGG